MKYYVLYTKLITFLLLFPCNNAMAKMIDVTVSGISFQPKIIAIQPGDTVRWSGMAGHSTALVVKLSPDEAMEWDAPVGSDFENTFTEEGIYIYKCKPHSNLGMAGAIIVGHPKNIDALRESGRNSSFKKIINDTVEYIENSAAKH